MHAHFRLFGPERFNGGSDVGKIVAERVYNLLERDANRGGDAKKKKVSFYKLDRGGKHMEMVDGDTAMKSECF